MSIVMWMVVGSLVSDVVVIGLLMSSVTYRKRVISLLLSTLPREEEGEEQEA